MEGRPYSTVFIKPLDRYGQFRRLWVRADNYTDGVTLDCNRASLSLQSEGRFIPAQRNTIGGEMYESVCLGRNTNIGFPQGSGNTGWPQQPPAYPGGPFDGMNQGPGPLQPYGQPSPIRQLLELLIR